ncbi:PGA18 [Symbiodinium natans]|uniref:PGA18 protein n=1 Tax=Symbiodinium natans TaxID=878477 RepID=A0A812Q5S1_9DINO|nr:PGA18 [Symbiodinium natans]
MQTLRLRAFALALSVLPWLTSAAVHSGYIYDRLCIDRGVGIDGVDGRRNPGSHSVHCNLVSICRNSGYGILTKPGGADLYSFEVLFSDRGNADVITWLGTQEYWGREVSVEVDGSYDTQGRLHVNTIRRLSDTSNTLWQGSGAGGAMTVASTSPSTTTPDTTPSTTSSQTGTASTTTPGATSTTTPGATSTTTPRATSTTTPGTTSTTTPGTTSTTAPGTTSTTTPGTTSTSTPGISSSAGPAAGPPAVDPTATSSAGSRSFLSLAALSLALVLAKR